MTSSTRKQARKIKKMLAAARRQPATPQASSFRKRKTTKQKLSKALSEADHYIDSLRRDVLRPIGYLPSPDYYGPVRKHFVQGRVQLSLANTANLHGGVVCNPWLMWMENFYYQKESGGVDTLCTVPTLYQHALTSTGAGLPNNYNGLIASVPLNGRIANEVAMVRTGHVRCLGVHFKLVYTGTWNNRGGSIVVFTNPGNIALATQIEGGAASQTPATGFLSAGQIDSGNDIAQVHVLSDEFSWTWRPSDLRFRRFDGYVPFSEQTVASGAASNQAAYDYLPDYSVAASQVETGWVTGFEFRPAAGTQGQLSNYYLDITAEYDLHESVANATALAGTANLLTTDSTHSDPIAAAKVQNALSATHQQRRAVSLMPAAKSLALTTMHAGIKIAKDATMEAMASRIAGIFG